MNTTAAHLIRRPLYGLKLPNYESVHDVDLEQAAFMRDEVRLQPPSRLNV